MSFLFEYIKRNLLFGDKTAFTAAATEMAVFLDAWE